jgi:acyl carrier protein
MGVLNHFKAMWARISSAQGGAPDGRATAPPAAVGGAAPTAPSTAEAIGAVLKDHIAEQSDGEHTADAIEGDAHLFDYGYLDSQSSASLMLLIEKRYGVRLKEVELVGRLSTVDALARHIAAALSEDEGATSAARGDEA